MKYIVLPLLALLLLAPVVNAAPTGVATVGSSGQFCHDYAVSAQATVISQGDIVYCVNSDGPVPSATSTFQMSAIIMTPALGTTPAVTFTATVKSGSCTFGTAVTAGTLLTGAAGTQSSATWEVTMASQNCHGYIEGKVVSTAVTVFDDVIAFDVESADITSYQSQCGATSASNTCTAPTYTQAGTVTIAQSGTWNIDAKARQCGYSGAFGSNCVIPTSDNQVRNCAASDPGALCLTPEIFTPDLVSMSAGPNLNRICDYPPPVDIITTQFAATGRIKTCVTFPNISAVGSTPEIMVTAETPRTALGGTGRITTSTSFTPDAGTGCSGSTVTSDNHGTNSGGTSQTEREDGITILVKTTMSGAQCTGVLQVTLNTAAAFYTSHYPIIIQSGQVVNSVMSGTINVAQSGTWSIDNQNRLCNASALGTACTTPTINQAITGTLTVTNAGGQTITVSGTLDNLNRICAASPLGSSCTVATINTNSISTIMGNSTQTVNFPGNLTIDLHSRGGLGNSNGPGYDWWLELTFWVLVFWYIMRNQNLFMLVFALGGVLHLVNSTWFFGLAQSLPWLGLGALLDLFIKYRTRKREDKKKKGAMT